MTRTIERDLGTRVRGSVHRQDERIVSSPHLIACRVILSFHRKVIVLVTNGVGSSVGKQYTEVSSENVNQQEVSGGSMPSFTFVMQHHAIHVPNSLVREYEILEQLGLH